MSRLVSIAACNFFYRPVSSFDEFAAHARTLLDQAKGADLVVFPELFTFELFTTLENWRDLPLTELPRIDKYTGAYRSLFASEAKERNQYLAAGSHLMKENGRCLNVGHLFGPDGSVHTHAKTHLAAVERDWLTEEGDTLEVVELPFAKVGLCICYEVEIPEFVASLTEQGAEIIICPSFATDEYGFWRTNLCSHAQCIMNQVYCVHSMMGGDPGLPLPPGWARSSILSPCDANIAMWTPSGTVAMAEPNTETVVRGRIDMDLLYESREKCAAATYRDRRRRAELYLKWPSHLTGVQRPA